MFDIEQHEAEWQQAHPESYSKAPKMVQLVIKYSGGLIKTEQGANLTLIVFVILMLAVTIYLLFGSGNGIDMQSSL